MKKIIVTGGNGFIGRHLVKKLISHHMYSVAIIANNIKNTYLADIKMQDAPLRFYSTDIRNGEAISKIFRNEKADICIHLAAKTSVVDSIQYPEETMDINVNGTLNVLEACHESQVKNFVFASSAAVYGDVSELPITETHALHPLSPYGTSKMLAEHHVFKYSRQKKVQNAVSLRIFNVYGHGQTSESDVITKFAARLSKGLSPLIYGNGLQTRDFISVDDVTDAILLSTEVMERSKNIGDNDLTSLVFNIGTGIPTSITELAEKMINIFGLDLHPAYETRRNEGIILHSYADVSRAKDILNFVPNKRIDDGLKEMILPLMS